MKTEDLSEVVETQATSVMKSMPTPQYCVLRAGMQSPDILRANNDDEAWTIVQRQVRAGQTAIVHLYKLIGAEAFESSSTRLTAEEVVQRPVPKGE